MKSTDHSYWLQKDDFSLEEIVDTPSLSRPALFFDFDGVITNPHALKSEIFNEMGFPIPPSETTFPAFKAIMQQQFPQKSLIEIDEIYQDMISQLFITRILDLPPETAVVDSLQKIRQTAAFSPVIITARQTSALSPEIRAIGLWLKQHQLRFDLIITAPEGAKAPIIDTLLPLIFVDDDIKNLSGINNPSTQVFLFRHPANQLINPPSPIKVIDRGWNEIDSIISRLP
jgi:hypothetical protein